MFTLLMMTLCILAGVKPLPLSPADETEGVVTDMWDPVPVTPSTARRVAPEDPSLVSPSQTVEVRFHHPQLLFKPEEPVEQSSTEETFGRRMEHHHSFSSNSGRFRSKDSAGAGLRRAVTGTPAVQKLVQPVPNAPVRSKPSVATPRKIVDFSGPATSPASGRGGTPKENFSSNKLGGGETPASTHADPASPQWLFGPIKGRRPPLDPFRLPNADRWMVLGMRTSSSSSTTTTTTTSTTTSTTRTRTTTPMTTTTEEEPSTTETVPTTTEVIPEPESTISSTEEPSTTTTTTTTTEPSTTTTTKTRPTTASAITPEVNYGTPEVNYATPEQIYGVTPTTTPATAITPEVNYGTPETNYATPELVYGTPETIHSQPETTTTTSTSTTSSSISTEAPDSALVSIKLLTTLLPGKGEDELDVPSIDGEETEQGLDSSPPDGVEEGTAENYLVEEKTPDGHIVGEFGVISRSSGSLIHGVRYVAHGSINPDLIQEALRTFLSLK